MSGHTVISPDQEVFTLINVFTVSPEAQQRLADTLAETTDVLVKHVPGFVSASIHKSTDGTRVVNYGQWTSQEAFGALMRRPEMQERIKQALQLGQPDGHFYNVAATVESGEEARPASLRPLEVYRKFQTYLFSGRFERMGEVVDLERYTENCVGFTPGWVTGFKSAMEHYKRNVAPSLSNVQVTEEQVIESADTVVIRSRTEATHTGPLLDIPPTGKRFAYDSVDILRTQEGRIVWRWLMSDLHAILRQLRPTSP